MGDRRVHVPRLLYDAVAHCSLHCYGCSHFSSYAPPGFVSVETFERDVHVLSRYMRAGVLKILGGEPLLHPHLLDLVRTARASGLARAIQIGTNGLLLDRQGEAFWREVDSVVVSVYPVSAARLDLDLFRRQAERHGTRLIVLRRPTFSEPAVDYPIRDAGLVQEIYRTCGVARLCHTVKDGRLFRCTTAPCIDHYLHRLGYATDFGETDGLRIEEREDMPARIRAYLRSDRPLGACRFCLSLLGPRVPHRQLTPDEIRRPRRRRRVEAMLAGWRRRKLRSLARWWTEFRRWPPSFRRALRPVWWARLRYLLSAARLGGGAKRPR